MSFSYTDSPVLENISFSVQEGDFISVIGPNGCGKTTLLRTISSELVPQSGSIRLNGKNIHSISPKERSRMASFVFTMNTSLPDYTIEQFLMLHTFPHDLPFLSDRRRDLAHEALKICGIRKKPSESIGNLSSGEFQLVQLAGACVQNSSFIILDEPVSHLDPKNAVMIIALLKKLNAEGTTVITVLHDLNIALNLPGKILALRNGGVFFFENPDTVYNKKLTDELYDIEFIYYRKNGRNFCLNDF